MEKENRTMGYRGKEIITEWDKFKDGVARCYVNEHSHGIHGVLSAIDLKENTAHFKPSVIFNLDNSRAYINNQDPSILPLPIKRISPLPEGMNLQDYVNEFNERKKEEREAMLMKGKRLIRLPGE